MARPTTQSRRLVRSDSNADVQGLDRSAAEPRCRHGRAGRAQQPLTELRRRPPTLESMFRRRRRRCGPLQQSHGAVERARAAGRCRPGAVDANARRQMFDPARWPELASEPARPRARAPGRRPELRDAVGRSTASSLKAQKLSQLRLEPRPRGVPGARSGRVERGAANAFSRQIRRAKASRSRPGASCIDLWIDIANETLVETHRTPEFLEAQRRLTRSSTEYRLQEREIAESFCEMHHIPTRTEVDELQRTVVRAAARGARADAQSVTADGGSRSARRRQARQSSARRARAGKESDDRPHCSSTRSSAAAGVRRAVAAQAACAAELLLAVKDEDVRSRTHAEDARSSARTRSMLYHYTPIAKTDASNVRCWSSTASSAATRWPTCRKTAR